VRGLVTFTLKKDVLLLIFLSKGCDMFVTEDLVNNIMSETVLENKVN
jgi:hypothetical protein